MTPLVRKGLCFLGGILVLLVLTVLILGWWLRSQMHASLPQLDGEASVAGLTGKVMIERDALGVPTIYGSTRIDVARALGFLHGQDRFFQMDLMRRRAAGELAELVGSGAVDVDKEARIHGFRKIAQATLAGLPAEQRALLEAYAAGVNTGLDQLHARPFEYLLLRADPQPWLPEDSVLVVHAMWIDLQDPNGHYEQSLAAIRDLYGRNAVAFFAPLMRPDDAALDGSTAPLPATPDPRQIDLRQHAASTDSAQFIRADLSTPEERLVPGSNGFAFAGTPTSGALVAGDMHLSLRIPNIWYRASLEFPSASGNVSLTGVTLPGSPAIVAGSNGHITWSFTNSQADTSDLVQLDLSDIDSSIYMSGTGLPRIENRPEPIRVKGGKVINHTVPWTNWGPIVGHNAAKKPFALHWVAHDPASTNFNLLELETATTVRDAINIAHTAGIPAQNFVVADSTGTIGWTIAGKLPKRVGLDGRLPVTWTFGDRRWDGYLSSEEIPTIIAPASGFLFTANQRQLGGEGLKLLGDGRYAAPQRAARIRDLLSGLNQPTPRDLLAIQLDDQTSHLTYWHDLLLATLNESALTQKKEFQGLRDALSPWDGRAAIDSASYRLVRAFRGHLAAYMLEPIFEPCVEVYPSFDYKDFICEPVLRRLVEEKPAHLLNPHFKRWDDVLLAAANDVLAELDKANLTPTQATWGLVNTAKINHPLSRFLPGRLVSWLNLNMAADPLAGDYNTPRVQTPDYGASERFVVSPGRESEGIFHMPGGQSGHPMSPFYQAGHNAWVKGEPTPFLPGPVTHTLRLEGTRSSN